MKLRIPLTYSAIIEALDIPWVSLVMLDSFYKGLEDGTDPKEYNFDHPDAFDFELASKILQELKQGKAVEVPHYSFVTHKRLETTTTVYGADVIIFEGIMTFWHALCNY
jgi:uridine kinase